MLPEKAAAALMELFRSCPEAERVYLYGSRAKGTDTARSDIDLALWAPEMSRAGFARLQYAVTFELPTLIPAEIARLDDAAADFRDRVMTRGVLLYDRNSNQT